MVTSLVSLCVFAGIIVFLLTLLLSHRVNLKRSFVSAFSAMILLTIIFASLWCIKYTIVGNDKFIVFIFAIVSFLFYIAAFWDMFHEHNMDIHTSLVYPLILITVALFSISVLAVFVSWFSYAAVNLP